MFLNKVKKVVLINFVHGIANCVWFMAYHSLLFLSLLHMVVIFVVPVIVLLFYPVWPSQVQLLPDTEDSISFLCYLCLLSFLD